MCTTGSIHICDFGEELPKKKGVSKGSVEEILDHIRARKRFSIFWATETLKRAKNLQWLVDDGIVEVDNSPGYPWSNATVNEGKLTPHPR